MATSYAHMYGEIIGAFLELSMIQYLKPTVESMGFYLDYKHSRPARNGAREVRWTDAGDNKHKLDIVIEEGGSESCLGKPRAFIEMAWRRYTKHSKNKVQEISGAIIPLIKKYQRTAPFYSAVLAGDFTNNSIEQLRSQGFVVCYIDLNKMEQIFSAFGFTVFWSENTSEDFFKEMVTKYQQLPLDIQGALYERFIEINHIELETLKKSLIHSLSRKLARVIITPMHGFDMPFATVQDACTFINSYDEGQSNIPISYYEIRVIFNTHEEYSCKCKEKSKAIEFLNNYV